MEFDQITSTNGRSLLTESFSSRTMRYHYQNPKEQAVAFLMTVGAKALVIEDQKASGTIDRENINAEAEQRKRIVTDERIRSIRRKILSRSALCVFKRGRDEKVRSIDITYNHDRQKGTYLSWKSKLNYLKKFEVTYGTVVSRIAVEEAKYHATLSASALSMSPRTHRRKEFFVDDDATNESSTTTDQSRPRVVSLPAVSFLRLTNQSRSLDLSFRSSLELEAFLLVLQKQAGLQITSDVFVEAESATSTR